MSRDHARRARLPFGEPEHRQHGPRDAAAQARVEACLKEFFTPIISAEDLFQQWSLFGEDVFLIPDEGEPPFSAMAYAKERSHAMVRRI